ncbi:hypothetical protein ACFOW6_05345 [Fodinicurvata halophila]|uniref:Uncharacterized protein n=1 Tax=Fodinicurvata halophila TaxID=1419723 RepID=A0ABV8UI61_9PROT
MHALKALVIGMGILIIIGMGLVIWGFARQATQLAEKSENGPSAESPFFETSVNLPAGCELDSVKGDGQGSLLLTLQGRDGPQAACRQIILLDTASGEVRGRIQLGSE